MQKDTASELCSYSTRFWLLNAVSCTFCFTVAVQEHLILPETWQTCISAVTDLQSWTDCKYFVNAMIFFILFI